MILFSDVGNCVADGLRRFECETSVQPLLRADFYYTRLPKLSTALLLLMFLFLFYFLFRFLLLSINLNSLAVKWTLCPSADSKLFFRFFFIYICIDNIQYKLYDFECVGKSETAQIKLDLNNGIRADVCACVHTSIYVYLLCVAPLPIMAIFHFIMCSNFNNT